MPEPPPCGPLALGPGALAPGGSTAPWIHELLNFRRGPGLLTALPRRPERELLAAGRLPNTLLKK